MGDTASANDSKAGAVKARGLTEEQTQLCAAFDLYSARTRALLPTDWAAMRNLPHLMPEDCTAFFGPTKGCVLFQPVLARTLTAGGSSLWEKLIGSMQDYNVTLRIVHGDQGWPLHSLRDNPTYKLYIQNHNKRKTRQQGVGSATASNRMKAFLLMPDPVAKLNGVKRSLELACVNNEELPIESRAIGLPGSAFSKPPEYRRSIDSCWRQQLMFQQTFLRGIEQRRVQLGALALHRSPFTTPISAVVVVFLNHDGKENKDNAAADNRCSTYSPQVVMDPQLHLGLHFLARLGGSAGQPLSETEADSGAWVTFYLTAAQYPEGPFNGDMVTEDRLSSSIRHAQKEVYGRVLPKVQHMARRVGAEESNSRGHDASVTKDAGAWNKGSLADNYATGPNPKTFCAIAGFKSMEHFLPAHALVIPPAAVLSLIMPAVIERHDGTVLCIVAALELYRSSEKAEAAEADWKFLQLLEVIEHTAVVLAQTVPLLAKSYPSHWIFEEHPLFTDQLFDAEGKWEAWGRLVWDSYSTVLEHQAMCEKVHGAGQCAPFSPPRDLALRAQQLGASWASECLSDAQRSDPVWAIAARQRAERAVAAAPPADRSPVSAEACALRSDLNSAFRRVDALCDRVGATRGIEAPVRAPALLLLDQCKRDLSALVERVEAVEGLLGADVLLDGRLSQDARLQVDHKPALVCILERIMRSLGELKMSKVQMDGALGLQLQTVAHDAMRAAASMKMSQQDLQGMVSDFGTYLATSGPGAFVPPPQAQLGRRAGRASGSAAERIEHAPDGPCVPLTGGARRVNGRACASAVLGSAALAAPESGPSGSAAAPEPADAPTPPPLVAIASEVQKHQQQTELDLSNPQHKEIFTAVLEFGKTGQRSFSFTAETAMQAIAEGLPTPVVLPPLGLGKDLTKSLNDGALSQQLLADLQTAGVASSAGEQAAAAVSSDEVLRRALDATDGWKLQRGEGNSSSKEGWRKGLKRMRVWFIEVALYRVLAQQGLRPPTLQGAPGARDALVLLQPGSIEGGLAGQLTAARHLASLLSDSATNAYQGFGAYANGISTTSGQNKTKFALSAKGLSLQNCCRRYCKLKSAGGAAPSQAANPKADKQEVSAVPAAPQLTPDGPSASAQTAAVQSCDGDGAGLVVPPPLGPAAASTDALLWPTRKRRSSRGAQRPNKAPCVDSGAIAEAPSDQGGATSTASDPGSTQAEAWHSYEYSDAFVEAARAQHSMMQITLSNRDKVTESKVAAVENNVAFLEREMPSYLRALQVLRETAGASACADAASLKASARDILARVAADLHLGVTYDQVPELR